MTTHGLRSHNMYNSYRGMKERCNNKNSKVYKYYGARGITVCKEWQYDFLCFYNWAIKSGYKKGLTIDRIDNDGNYDPSNCRWVNMSIQNSNKRPQSNNTSGYIGVNYRKSDGFWVARITVNRKNIFLKYSRDKNKLARLRNEFIIKNNLSHSLNKIVGDLNV